MKVFKESARIFQLHCYLPPNSTNKWKNYGCILYVSFFVLCFLLSGASIYQMVIVAGPLYSFFVAQFTKKDIENTFTDFQSFYDRNKGMDPLGLMRKAERRGRRMVNIFLSFAVICVAINLATSIGSLLYHIIRDGDRINYGEVHRPYRYVLPWDQTTLNGWICELAFSVFLPPLYFIISSGFLTLLATICEYHRSFCKIIDFHLASIDSVLCRDTYRLVDLIKMLRETVSFHYEAKQLFVRSADLFSFFVAGELIHFSLLMTFVAFLLDFAARNLSLDLVVMMLGVVYATMVLYVYCYYGQTATDLYAAIADHFYESNWMNAPRSLQRMYVLMIAHAQKEMHYRGYGTVELNLENFLKIIQSIVGYVLMFKTLAEQDA